MGEARTRTQHYVAQSLNDKAGAAVRIPCVYLAFESDGLGYIVSEYIDGSICNNADAALVAATVQSLPHHRPGPNRRTRTRRRRPDREPLPRRVEALHNVQIRRRAGGAHQWRSCSLPSPLLDISLVSGC